MASTPPRQEIATLRKSFFDEELLNKQFASLEEVGRLPSNRNPQFAEEVSTLYFRDSADVIASMERTLEKAPVDFSMIDMNLHHLKSGSVSIGANKVTIQINLLREYFEQHNLDSFKGTIEQLKLELAYLKSKLVHYFQLLRQAEPVEAAERPL